MLNDRLYQLPQCGLFCLFVESKVNWCLCSIVNWWIHPFLWTVRLAEFKHLPEPKQAAVWNSDPFVWGCNHSDWPGVVFQVSIRMGVRMLLSLAWFGLPWPALKLKEMAHSLWAFDILAEDWSWIPRIHTHNGLWLWLQRYNVPPGLCKHPCICIHFLKAGSEISFLFGTAVILKIVDWEWTYSIWR